MRQNEVSSVEQLDARLAIDAMRKHSQLWRIAEGRYTWRETVALIVPLILLAMGAAQLMEGSGLMDFMAANAGTTQIVLGVALLASFMWNQTQRQLKALMELVRRLEQDR